MKNKREIIILDKETGEKHSGLLVIDFYKSSKDEGIFILSNLPELCGSPCENAYKFGYKCSWILEYKENKSLDFFYSIKDLKQKYFSIAFPNRNRFKLFFKETQYGDIVL